ncbi:hypothetical protein CK203_022742 [Vitis vinifera]|uniref:Uncharacterized protein n=1 Tax=Vitis vinifera TaxID=29760 RepID=A0A438IWZ8_VITVI|nr:hypothetical protein CK203_022742 [Vitis vinifera]
MDIVSSHSWSHSNQKMRKSTSLSLKKPKQRRVEEISRKLKGKKSEQKQRKNRSKTELYEISQPKENFCEMSILLPTIPQHFEILYENFRSCEGEFGTRVPLRSTGVSISQLRNVCEVHSDINFAAAKRIAKWL